jgi:flagellar biosynthesis anti-sigma factor FlgM
MKIGTEHVGRLLEARLERIHRASAGPRQLIALNGSADRVSFSPLAADLRAALAAARSAEEVADPRLEALKKEVASGRYQAPPQAVAEAMLRDSRR